MSNLDVNVKAIAGASWSLIGHKKHNLSNLKSSVVVNYRESAINVCEFSF